MTVFLILLIAWLFLTVLGHASWLLIATILKAIFGSVDSDFRPRHSNPASFTAEIEKQNKSSLGQFQEVITGMIDAGQLTQDEGSALIQKAGLTLHTTLNHSPAPVVNPVPTTQGFSSPEANPVDDPIPVAELVSEELEAVEVDPALTSAEQVAVKPVSWSAVVGSFLEQRNIRWGEIAAGLLIVFCSIGLVGSLWTTLTATHRVIPSFIFVTANAAIFAAGFYTLSRWRVRTTSRAVLIIATLLVPLSVLAGLAAAGNGGAGASVSDPVLLAAMVIGGCVYGWLLKRSGLALVGRPLSWSSMTATLGPVLMLPLMPTIVRNFGDGSGWFVLVGSLMVAGSWLVEPLLRKQAIASSIHQSGIRTLSRRGASIRSILLMTGSFALTCLVAYTAFLIFQSSSDSDDYRIYIPLALATLPAATTLAASARRYANQAADAIWRLAGNSTALFAVLGIGSMLAAVVGDAGWLWAWGGLTTLATLSVTLAMRRPIWITAACLPVGISAVMTSTQWLGNASFESLAVWQRLVSGPALITIALISLVLAVSIRLFSQQTEISQRSPGPLSLIGWSSMSVILASALLLGPVTWLCGVSESVIACSLLAAATACILSRVSLAGAISTGTILLGVAHFARGIDPSLVVGLTPLVTTKLCFTWATMLATVSMLSHVMRTDHQQRICEIMLASAIGLVGFAAVFWFARMIVGVDVLPDFGSPIMTYAIPSVAWITVLLHLKLGTTSEWMPERSTFVSLACFGFVLWFGTSVGWSLVSDSKTQLIITVSTLIGIVLAGGAVLNRNAGFPRKEIAGLLAVAVSIASAKLFGLHWANPLLAGQSIDATATAALMTWWVAIGLAAGWFSLRQNAAILLPLTTLLLISAISLAMPWLGWTHPVTLIQGMAALAMPAFFAIKWMDRLTKPDVSTPPHLQFHNAANSTCDGLWTIVWLIGLASCVATLVALVFQISELHFVFGIASLLVSAFAVFWWTFGRHTLPRSIEHPLPWPMIISFMSGHIGGLLLTFDFATTTSLPLVVGLLWFFAAASSIVRLAFLSWRSDAWHAWILIFASFTVSAIYYPGLGVGGPLSFLFYVGMASLVAGGIWTMVAERSGCLDSRIRQAQYIMGFFVTIGGAIFLSQTVASNLSSHWILSIAIGWIASWVIAWRLACPDTGEKRSSIPDVALQIAIVGILSVLCLDFWNDSYRVGFPSTWPADLTIVATVMLLVATIACRSSRPGAIEAVSGMIVLTACLTGMKLGVLVGAFENTLIPCGLLSSAVVIALGSLLMNPVIRSLASEPDEALHGHRRLIRSCWVAASLIWIAAIIVAIHEGLFGNRLAAHLAIGATAILTFALSELSERARHAWKQSESALKMQTVITGLSMVILIAVVESLDEVHPALTITMRILVAMIVFAPTLMFVLPMLLGSTIANRWAMALRRGSIAAGGIAAGSAATMLALEFFARTPGVGIADLPKPLVWMVGCVLAAFSLLAAAVAVATGPGGMLQSRLKLPDRGRLVAIYAAQAFAGITWIHKYLCLDKLAFIGLRAYWPYVVMALAFASVGLTQWAMRRKDAVLADQLRRTSLFLPLIPLIGFWMSAWFNNNTVNGDRGSDLANWVFGGGSVPYEWLLMMTAIYYIGTSVLWKRTGPRVTGIVLANAALWVWLVQFPGWGFLAHPQAWLIPPAVCVMAIAHFSREQLGATAATAIRTAATLVIYVSSTADMLIADIGSTLAGPMVLISLALAGMLAGVVLRVRSFLFLGLMFVVIGLLSMVWHAQQAIDAVWPWWVFGITTGILILIGLAMLEKNKPKLQQYASRLSAWEV